MNETPHCLPLFIYNSAGNDETDSMSRKPGSLRLLAKDP